MGNEHYPHEFVHAIAPQNNDMYYIANEGMANYFGTRLNGTDKYNESMQHLAEAISIKPDEFDFESVLSGKARFYKSMVYYPAGATIWQIVDEQKGDTGLNKLMRARCSNYSEFVNAACEITGLKQSKLEERWYAVVNGYGAK